MVKLLIHLPRILLIFFQSLIFILPYSNALVCQNNQIPFRKFGGYNDYTLLNCLDYRSAINRVLIGGSTASLDIAYRDTNANEINAGVLIEQTLEGEIIWNKGFTLSSHNMDILDCFMDDHNVFAMSHNQIADNEILLILDHQGNLQFSAKILCNCANTITRAYEQSFFKLDSHLYTLFYTGQWGSNFPFIQDLELNSPFNDASSIVSNKYYSLDLGAYSYQDVHYIFKEIKAVNTVNGIKIYVPGRIVVNAVIGTTPVTYYYPVISKLNLQTLQLHLGTIYMDSQNLPGGASSIYNNMYFQKFDILFDITGSYFIGFLDQATSPTTIMRLLIQHPNFIPSGIVQHYTYSEPNRIYRCNDVIISPDTKIMVMYILIYAGDVMIYKEYLASVVSMGGGVGLHWHLLQYQTDFAHKIRRLRIVNEYPITYHYLFIFSSVPSVNSNLGPGSKLAGFLGNFYVNLPSVYDCRKAHNPDQILLNLEADNPTSSSSLFILSISEQAFTLDQSMYTQIKCINLITSSSFDNPTTCPAPRTITKYPAFIEPVIVHNSATTVPLTKYQFYPDIRMKKVTGCDAVNLHYELRMQTQTDPVPYIIRLTADQATNSYSVDIQQMSATATITYALKLVLVDYFGDYVETPFKIAIVSPTVGPCRDIDVYPPIIQDQTYVIGSGPQWYKYEFYPSDPDSNNIDCYGITSMSFIVLYPSGQIGDLPPDFMKHSLSNKSIKIQTQDLAHLGVYNIKIIAMIPGFNTRTQLINKAETVFQIKIIQKEQDFDFPCKIIAPNIKNYYFNVNNGGSYQYLLPEFTFSSTFCEDRYLKQGLKIQHSIFSLYSRPATAQPVFIDNCFTISQSISGGLILSVNNSLVCIGETPIRIEGFVTEQFSTFRKISALSRNRIVFSNDPNYNSQITPPQTSYGTQRLFQTIYYDIRWKYNAPEVTYDYSAYQIENPAYGDIRSAAVEIYYPWVPGSKVYSALNNYYVTISTNNVKKIGEYQVISSVKNTLATVFGQVFLTIQVYDSLGCDMTVINGMPSNYEFYADQEEQEVYLKGMSTTPQCQYQRIYYSLFDQNTGDSQLPRMMSFYYNSTYTVLTLKKASDNDEGIYYLTLKGELNPYIFATYNFTVTVKKKLVPANTGSPKFLQKPQNLIIQAGKQIQYDMPFRIDPDHDKIICFGYYNNAVTPFPKWVLFNTLICAWTFSPTDEDLGTHNFQILLRDKNKQGAKQSKPQYFTVKVTESKSLLEQMRVDKLKKEDYLYTVGYKVGLISDVGTFPIMFERPMKANRPLESFNNTQLELILIKNESAEVKLKFKAVRYDRVSSTLTVQIIFDDPKKISLHQDRDVLKVTFLRTQFFRALNEERYVDSSKHVNKEIPKQNLNKETEVKVTKGLNVVQQATNTLIFGNLGLNIVLQEYITQNIIGLHLCNSFGE